jgi:tetratricopeptide (TPR) repeat protein
VRGSAGGCLPQLVETVGSLEGLAWFPSQGVCDRVYGIIFAQRGELARARQHFKRSIQILSDHGYKPDLARSSVALGQFLRDQERLTEARAALEKAFVLFREMGFTPELGQTLGILKTISRA